MYASSPTPSAPRPVAATILVSARLPVVVRAGLESLLRPHADRVELLAADQDDGAVLEVFDPEDPAPLPGTGAPRIALTWDTSPEATARARDLGAVRVLPLSASVLELLAAIEQVHGTHPSVHRATPAEDEVALSPREADVVRGICRGLSNLEIADELFLSVNSVKTYIRTAYRKMEVTSRSQAVLWGFAHGL